MPEVINYKLIPGAEIFEPREDEPRKTLSFECVVPGTNSGCGQVQTIIFMHTGWVVDGDKIFWLDTGEKTPEQMYEAGGDERKTLGALIMKGHIAVHHLEAKTVDIIE